ncbi:MAG: hypothetical protein IID32_10340, partial [Planctomycetes bacterium]|nr:hypothetical protein [Planctomycetota bacterium]
VVIAGHVEGSSAFGEESFAIAAVGQVGSVLARRQVFEGQDNVKRIEVEEEKIIATTVTVDDISDKATALASAIQIRADGLDHRFEYKPGDDIHSDLDLGDDILIFGDSGPNADPDVFITFDQETNTVSFHKRDSFGANDLGTHYYQIIIDGDMIVNRQGLSLDGDFSEGRLPTGDGIPGGVFVYYFAVADLGDTVVTAFDPFPQSDFAQFPTNVQWNFTGQLGDNQQFSTSPVLDRDFVKLNDLEAGQILTIDLEDATRRSLSPFDFDNSGYQVSLWQVKETQSPTTSITTIAFGDRSDLDPSRSLVAPELDELAYAVDSYYGYENVGKQFYRIDPNNFGGTTLLANSLTDLNGLPSVSSKGTITDLQAFTGHSLDSFWAMATFQPGTGAAQHKLILIKKLSVDVTDINLSPEEKATIEFGTRDLNLDGFANIVGLEELDGVLYGIDADTNTLVEIDSDLESNTFGEVISVKDLGRDDLVITGLTVNPELKVNPQANDLILLHDGDSSGLYPEDGLYGIDKATGKVESLPLQTFALDSERHGLASQAGASVLIGLPLRGSPAGDAQSLVDADVVKISLNDGDPVPHIFGSDTTIFTGNVLVSSDVSDSSKPNLQVNRGLLDFVAGGFYYAFDISFVPNSGVQTVIFSDIDWVEDLDEGFVIDVVTDEPGVATVTMGFVQEGLDLIQTIQIDIQTTGSDGDITVYFAGTGRLERLQSIGSSLGGAVIGDQTRSDLDPVRNLILDDLEELTISEDGYGSFDAVGYDADQDIFVLVDTSDLAAEPIFVEDPFDPNETVVLTGKVISDIYEDRFDSNPDVDVTLTNFRGLEFGRESETSLQGNQLWLLVTVVETNINTDA